VPRRQMKLARGAKGKSLRASVFGRRFPFRLSPVTRRWPIAAKQKGKVPMDSTPSGPQANPDQGSRTDVKAPMDPTPSRPQVNTDQGRTDVKALEEALSKLVGEGTASAFERRAQMAGSDAVWADEPSLRATPRIADLKDHPFLGDTPSPRSRFSRALTRFLVVAFIGVGCTLAWQSYGETAKQKLATSAPQLGWVLSLAGLKPWPAELIAERSSGPAVQESPDLPQAVSAAQVTPDVGTPPTSAARAPEVRCRRRQYNPRQRFQARRPTRRRHGRRCLCLTRSSGWELRRAAENTLG
jgi:hypothetical protein